MICKNQKQIDANHHRSVEETYLFFLFLPGNELGVIDFCLLIFKKIRVGEVSICLPSQLAALLWLPCPGLDASIDG
jgi:hypothetical protein